MIVGRGDGSIEDLCEARLFICTLYAIIKLILGKIGKIELQNLFCPAGIRKCTYFYIIKRNMRNFRGNKKSALGRNTFVIASAEEILIDLSPRTCVIHKFALS